MSATDPAAGERERRPECADDEYDCRCKTDPSTWRPPVAVRLTEAERAHAYPMEQGDFYLEDDVERMIAERCRCASGLPPSDDGTCPWLDTPAEPEAGDVEALAKVIDGEVYGTIVVRSEHESGCPGGGDYCASHCPIPVQDYGDTTDLVRAILASDWLDAVRRKAGDERAEQIAQDIRDRRRTFSALNADEQYLSALDDAFGLASNRIARESR